MSEVFIRIDSQMIEILHKYDASIEELFILRCMEGGSSTEDFILNYTRAKSNLQKIAMMQSLVRKQFVTQELDFCLLEENFAFSHYKVTRQGSSLCNEMGKMVVHSTTAEKVGAIKFEDIGRNVSAILNPEQTNEVIEFDKFIKAYLNLFPIGKNGGNKTLKSNEDDVKAKMIKFFNRYKRFTKEDVIKSTERFLRSFRNDFTFCPTAEYFILKDNSSALATECDSRRRSIETEGDESNSSPFQQLM